ncbi:MAG TPA: hypothetical protein VF576_07385, partial [Rubricoccaceae bacterium]
ALDHDALHADALGGGPAPHNCRVAAAPPRPALTARVVLRFARPAVRAVLRLTVRALRRRVGL